MSAKDNTAVEMAAVEMPEDNRRGGSKTCRDEETYDTEKGLIIALKIHSYDLLNS